MSLGQLQQRTARSPRVRGTRWLTGVPRHVVRNTLADRCSETRSVAPVCLPDASKTVFGVSMCFYNIPPFASIFGQPDADKVLKICRMYLTYIISTGCMQGTCRMYSTYSTVTRSGLDTMPSPAAGAQMRLKSPRTQRPCCSQRLPRAPNTTVAACRRMWSSHTEVHGIAAGMPEIHGPETLLARALPPSASPPGHIHPPLGATTSWDRPLDLRRGYEASLSPEPS